MWTRCRVRRSGRLLSNARSRADGCSPAGLSGGRTASRRGSRAWNDFRGKTLYVDEGLKAAVLDPRFPEVREYLIAAYERALRDWDIDGFKFDFIDLFRIRGTDPAVAEGYAGRDCRGVPEAVERLLTDAMARLKGLKPDLLVEFRQPYVSAAIRRYGNMFRAGVQDVPVCRSGYLQLSY